MKYEKGDFVKPNNIACGIKQTTPPTIGIVVDLMAKETIIGAPDHQFQRLRIHWLTPIEHQAWHFSYQILPITRQKNEI